jgi:hypothetical protein
MANPFHDERGRFGSAGSGGSGRSKLTGEAKRRVGEAVAHRERVANNLERLPTSVGSGGGVEGGRAPGSALGHRTPGGIEFTRASDARGVDPAESRPMRIISRQTREHPPRKDRGTSGAGRSFYG